jgi:hypothetical protein
MANTTIRNINPSLGNTVEDEFIEEMAQAIAACGFTTEGYTTEDGELVEGRDYETPLPADLTQEAQDAQDTLDEMGA